jgi:hypothetical protein
MMKYIAATLTIGLKQPQYAVDMRQVRTVLFQLAFQLLNEPSD